MESLHLERVLNLLSAEDKSKVTQLRSSAIHDRVTILRLW
jgi:hypothetical protein